MVAIATSTATNTIGNAFGYPPNSMMDINVQTGELWIVFRDQTNRGAVYKSSDNGVSWSFQANFTVSGYTIEDIQEMRIDAAGRDMHMVLLLLNGSSSEEMHYKRLDISTGSVGGTTGSLRFSGPAGSAQSLIYSSACVPVVNPDGSTHVFLACAQHSATSSGVRVYAMTVKADVARTTVVNDAIIGSVREWKTSGDDTQLTVSLDVEHNGDGITSSNPNVWVTWLKDTTIYAVRCTWKGYKAGWGTPNTAATVATGRLAERDVIGRWDGTRFVIASPNPSSNQQVQLIERNASNSGNVATRTSTSNGFSNLSSVGKGLSYNHVTKDARFFAALNSSVYYIDYFRATNTWGSWTSTGWPDPLGGSKSEMGVRRGTYGTSQYDGYVESGASSPWNVAGFFLPVNFTPTAPTWIIGQAGTVSVNGGAFDVTASLTLDWTFNDPNKGDTQSAYALQRQIGTGTIQWWRASDSTWQTVETFNSTGTTAVTLTPAQWVGGGGSTDPAHVYKVSVKDSGTGTLQSPYSIGLAIVPSTRVDPTLTSPTVNQILATGVIPVTWTVTEQAQWRVTVKPTIVNDQFGRTASSSWGSADTGGAYTTNGGSASEYNVNSGVGKMTFTGTAGPRQVRMLGVTTQDVNVLMALSISAAPTGAAAEVDFYVRYIDSNNYVKAQLFFNPANTITTHIVSVIGGVATQSVGFPSVSGATSTSAITMRFIVAGDQAYLRVWTGSTEPTDWLTTLSGVTLLDAGMLIIESSLNSGNTNATETFSFDNLQVAHSSLVSYDSGWTTDPIPATPVTLAFTPPKTFPDGYAGIVTLQTRNAEGLAGGVKSAPITIDFVEPVSPVPTLTNTPAAGGITVTVSQAAASGSQPATSMLEVWRRETVAGQVNPVNANPYFEANATDWTSSGYSTVARSTSQAYSGVASLLCTPNGSTATPKAQTTALYATVAGTTWEFRGWLRSTTANKTIRCYIDFYDSTPTLISSTVEDVTPVAGAWVYNSFSGVVPYNATQARIAIGQLATPAAGDTLFGDELQLVASNGDEGITVFRDVVTGVGYLDWRTVTGRDYEYRVKAVGVNGTETYGPWID